MQIAAQMVCSGGLNGAPFGVTSGDAYHGLPTVANDSVNHRFLVAWIQMRRTSSPRSLPRSASGSGSRARCRSCRCPTFPSSGQLFDNFGTAIGVTHEVSTVPDRQHGYPRLAFDPMHVRFLAVFQTIENLTGLAARRRESAMAFPSRAR